MFLKHYLNSSHLFSSESLRSIQSCPRSISDRIVHKLAMKNRKSSEFRHNPYHELEAAYVAQVHTKQKYTSDNSEIYVLTRLILNLKILDTPAVCRYA